MSSQEVIMRTTDFGDFAGTLHSPRLATLPRVVTKKNLTGQGERTVVLTRVDIPWLVLGSVLGTLHGYHVQRYAAFAEDPRDGEWRSRLLLTSNGYRRNYVCLGRELLPDSSFWNTPFTTDVEFVKTRDEFAARVTRLDGRVLLPRPERLSLWRRLATRVAS